MGDKKTLDDMHEGIEEGRFNVADTGTVVSWCQLPTMGMHIQTGCPECLGGRGGFESLEAAYAWGLAHQCSTPVCKQCKRHMRDDMPKYFKGDICWECGKMVATLSNGKRVNQTMLRAGFEKVKHPVNWKYPCKGIVKKQELPLVMEAIRYYTGGGGEAHLWQYKANGKHLYKVTAPGYYGNGMDGV